MIVERIRQIQLDQSENVKDVSKTPNEPKETHPQIEALGKSRAGLRSLIVKLFRR